VSADREKDIKKLINDLVTECTRCKCEIRLRDIAYQPSNPVLCPKCRRLPKTPAEKGRPVRRTS
jgi:hypothetical protein